jgi:sortase (surface protein transpeptidase)
MREPSGPRPRRRARRLRPMLIGLTVAAVLAIGMLTNTSRAWSDIPGIVSEAASEVSGSGSLLSGGMLAKDSSSVFDREATDHRLRDLVAAYTATNAPSDTLSDEDTSDNRDANAASDGQRFTTTATFGSLDAANMPARLSIPSIGVDAPIEAVGLDGQGRMEIPSSGSRVGWYARGSLPGDSGTAVLTSHVDTAAEGPGVLFGLRHVDRGDRIELTDASGNVSPWVVVATTQQHKDDLPSASLFAAEGPARIAIVTCAGRFDRTTRTYEDNLIVWAEPA